MIFGMFAAADDDGDEENSNNKATKKIPQNERLPVMFRDKKEPTLVGESGD